MASETVLDAEKSEIKTSYCIPLWKRDAQLRANCQKVKARFSPTNEVREDAVALVAFGPSLNDTWKDIGQYKHVITMSGSHKFLLKKYRPSHFENWWHIEVDPRSHKIELMGKPHKKIQYLLASCVHPKVLEHLKGMNVSLWHVYANDKDRSNAIPKGEWSLTGGSNVGLRSMAIARSLGFTKQHIFGMDCCARDGQSHAMSHPNGPKRFNKVPFLGQTYQATGAMVTYARSFFHELEQLGDVEAKIYGIGLLQHMAFKRLMLNDLKREAGPIGVLYKKTYSESHIEAQKKLHEDPNYGANGARRADTVLRLANSMNTTKVLDYGAGKGCLAKELPFPIWEYDPATGKEDARPADLVICTEVLEHVEPEYLEATLADLARCTLKVGYFVIRGEESYWKPRIAGIFKVGKVLKSSGELHIVVGPRKQLAKAA